MDRHFELHVALTAEEADSLTLAGLPSLKDTEICSNCGTAIGAVDGNFVPLALVLDTHREHNLCLSCVAPVLRPKS